MVVYHPNQLLLTGSWKITASGKSGRTDRSKTFKLEMKKRITDLAMEVDGKSKQYKPDDRPEEVDVKGGEVEFKCFAKGGDPVVKTKHLYLFIEDEPAKTTKNPKSCSKGRFDV